MIEHTRLRIRPYYNVRGFKLSPSELFDISHYAVVGLKKKKIMLIKDMLVSHNSASFALN